MGLLAIRGLGVAGLASRSLPADPIIRNFPSALDWTLGICETKGVLKT